MNERLNSEFLNSNKNVLVSGKYCLLGEISDFFSTPNNIAVLDIYCSNEDLNNQVSHIKVIVRGSNDNNLFIDCYTMKDVTGGNTKNRIWATRAVKNGNSILIYTSTKNNDMSNIFVAPFINDRNTYLPRMEFSDTFVIPENYTDHIVGGWVLAR